MRWTLWWWPVLLLLASCTGQTTDAIRFGLASAPTNLDPRFATDATSARINRLLYERLVEFDHSSRPQPGLADWEQLGPRHYRFRLRDESRFHNGDALTMEDVAATYRSILDPGTRSPHRGTLEIIERLELVDERQLDFFIKRPDPLFPAYLAIGVVPQQAIRQQHPLHSAPLGSGRYRLQDWPGPEKLRLNRREDGQQLVFLTVGDPTVRVLKLIRGELDIIQNDLPAELVRYLEQQDAIQVERGPGSNYAYIGFQLEDPHTGNPLVRKAIAHAIDRQSILDYLFAGAGRQAQGLLPPDHWAGHAALAPYDFDPAKARKLLAMAGYGPGQPLTLEYKTSADPLRIRIVTVLQQQLSEVGIQLRIRSYDWGTFYGDIKAGRFQMYSLAWVGIKTPDIFRYAFHSESLPPRGANRGRLHSPEIDRLIEVAAAGQTVNEQGDRYRTLQEALHRDLPYVPLWYEDHVVAMNRNLQGYRLAADGNYDGLKFITRRVTTQ